MSNTVFDALINDMANEISLEKIHKILSGDRFSFSGTFYHASRLTNPLNPCLTIDGLGLIGLPLGERDTKAIIASSTSTPFDPGERIVPDKDVQNIWEIEASKILFANPGWEDYVNNTLCSMLCDSLGITNPPKMELHKLFLYGTGSQFISNQNSSEADGVFARATILLPSAYTGGNIILSHVSRTKAIECSQPPLLSTSILAWYTEVKQEIKPIDSGYCLALSYNLVHPSQDNSPESPLPRLPVMQDSILQLRDVLKQWKGRQNPPKFIAHLLDHQYTSIDLLQGVNTLKGADLHRVTHIRPVAEQLGFRVCLGSLDHKIRGLTDDNGEEYYMRPRHLIQAKALEEGIPKLRKVYSTATTIFSLVDLKDLSILSAGKINVGKDCLTVRNPFNKDHAPDEANYHRPYLDYRYKRTCLVLMREEDVDTILYLAEGAPYVIRMLKKSTNDALSSYHRQWVKHLLKEEKPIAAEYVLGLLEFAIKWKDITMWNSITSNHSCTLGVMNSEILKNSMEIFDFDALRSSYEIVLKRSFIFSEKIEFLSQISSISPANEKEIVNAWCQEENHKIVLSSKSLEIKDIPAIIRSFGPEDFDKILIPNLKNKENYGFCIAFVKTLLQNRQTIVEQESSFTTPKFQDHAAVNGLVKQCLLVAVPHWKFREEPKSPYFIIWDRKVDRIMEIVEQAMDLPDLDICRELLIDILKYPYTEGEKFNDVYIPLVPRLRNLLAAKDQGFFQQPFVGFIQVVIGLYLRDVVGKKGELPNVKLRKIGCGCQDCKMLDRYIMNYNDHDTEYISVAQPRRLHLERQLKAATDLCTYDVHQGRPSTLHIKKKPAVVEVSKWLYRQKCAKEFLGSIGSDADISRIMGSRYADVKYAVDGLRSFGSVITNTPSASTTAGSAPAVTGSMVTTRADGTSTSLTAQAQDPVASSSVIGVTRHASETGFSQQGAGKRPKV